MTDPPGPQDAATGLVKELLARLEAHDVRELEVSAGDLRVRVSRDASPATSGPAPTAPVANAVSAPAAAAGPAMATVVTAGSAAKAADAIVAPLTGIFYRSASPQSPPFVQPGTVVNAGDVIGLIEAMKLFNEIRSTKSGTVRRVLAENGQLVRAKQPLVELDPA